MDWIVFGDDWEGHPSTTQHLVRHLPAGDRVIWVDSLGMRSPRANARDLTRVVVKAGRALGKLARPTEFTAPQSTLGFGHFAPTILPWHKNRLATGLNRRLIRRGIERLRRAIGFDSVYVLAATPVAINYLPDRARQVAYLRLDDYSKLPGVDPDLVAAVEPRMMARADLVVATAERLLGENGRRLYLKQGVDTGHFGGLPLEPPSTRTLGFFGLLAEWIDYDLIRAVAQRAPDWTLEFIGPVRAIPEDIRNLPNVRLRPAVPYKDLPDAIASWRAAWLPFEVSELTEAVNPLKIREYLAAGLPTIATPLREVADLDFVKVTPGVDEVVAALGHALDDTADQRSSRRESVTSDGWASRAATLRQTLIELDNGGH